MIDCTVFFNMAYGQIESEPEGPLQLQRGDLVEILLGPATGKIGLISTIQRGSGDRVMEDAGAARLRIGVGLIEPIEVAPELVAILRVADLLSLDEAPRQEVMRWFNNPNDLKLLVRGGADS